MNDIPSDSNDGAIRIWDWPVRLTHWLFVLCIAVSWWSAEEHQMEWHRYSGYTLLGLLIFRIYWGFTGSSSARFSHFLRGPSGVIAYLRESREAHRDAGHNPLGGWSVAIMLVLMLSQVSIGLFVSDVDGIESGPLSHLVSFETSRTLADIHEVVFNVILAFIGLHIAAILFYLLAKRDNLIVAMLTGQRRDARIRPMRPVPAWRILPGIVLATGVVWWVAA
ncbi:cytochrome b/b6 domain-containing protein [Steroidobacter sp. S1-65]|uniref:Cytochrome b/b6 domain-containing protein n=1 Tax=Steroidobacter gossypii TaxID=2805490 RepID=A0ABS1WSJ8_9GAMM|nr:cytochrome b/b6 domain-containing protein [Steroidobacter gossypii]MBM0103962.1 cytochrome b/b6 domain-containing protein [Steroidobacter gossypii]